MKTTSKTSTTTKTIETSAIDAAPPISIAILDKGFVYVGRVSTYSDGSLIIRGGHNIRTWGTSKGLSELAFDGPITGKTILDKCPDIFVPSHSVSHLLACDESKWAKLIR